MLTRSLLLGLVHRLRPRFDGQVQEIFDVQVLHAKMPEIIEPGSELAASSFVVPTAALEGGR